LPALWLPVLWLAGGCQWVIEPEMAVQLGEPFTLAPGEMARLPAEALTIGFQQVVSDDRCPRQLACEWPGEARLLATVQASDLPTRTFELSSYGYAAEDGMLYTDYAIRLVEVAPYPEESMDEIAPDAYRATFQVEPAPESPITIMPDEAFQLRVGETAQFADGALAVTWERLADDSRCPTMVSCIWAGEARLAITVSDADDAQSSVELTTNPAAGDDRVVIGPYELRLLDVTPDPQWPDEPIRPGEYAARFALWASQQ
jgi:hypothetical protein